MKGGTRGQWMTHKEGMKGGEAGPLFMACPTLDRSGPTTGGNEGGQKGAMDEAQGENEGGHKGAMDEAQGGNEGGHKGAMDEAQGGNEGGAQGAMEGNEGGHKGAMDATQGRGAQEGDG